MIRLGFNRVIEKSAFPVHTMGVPENTIRVLLSCSAAWIAEALSSSLSTKTTTASKAWFWCHQQPAAFPIEPDSSQCLQPASPPHPLPLVRRFLAFQESLSWPFWFFLLLIDQLGLEREEGAPFWCTWTAAIPSPTKRKKCSIKAPSTAKMACFSNMWHDQFRTQQ